jgi:hypothetical protein
VGLGVPDGEGLGELAGAGLGVLPGKALGEPAGLALGLAAGLATGETSGFAKGMQADARTINPMPIIAKRMLFMFPLSRSSVPVQDIGKSILHPHNGM